MKRMFFIALSACVLSGCAGVKNTFNNKNVQVIEEQLLAPSSPLVLPISIPANTSAMVNYKCNSKSILHIQFNNFAIAGVASNPEKWGYFQFPAIGRKLDGSLQVSWNMKDDAMSAYGKDNYGSANSVDDGKTWTIQQKNETIGSVLLLNGDRLKITTPKPYNIQDLKLPKALDSAKLNYWKQSFIFFRLSDLPDSCRSVYLQRLKKGETEWKTE